MQRLILVEGLPGTGKTTISKWVSDFLIERGDKVTLLSEGDERIPCDFYETAGIPISEFETLCAQNPLEWEAVHENALRTENYVFLRIDKCSDSIAKTIKRWDMGDESNQKVTVAEYTPCALERLRHWVNFNITNSETVIVDSGYLQNPINELLFRQATNDDVRTFIGAITDMLKPLNPVCIYLRRNDADEAILFAKNAKGKGWADRVDELLKKNDCENLFQNRFALELELIQNIEHISCHICGSDWDNAKTQIRNYLTA